MFSRCSILVVDMFRSVGLGAGMADKEARAKFLSGNVEVDERDCIVASRAVEVCTI